MEYRIVHMLFIHMLKRKALKSFIRYDATPSGSGVERDFMAACAKRVSNRKLREQMAGERPSRDQESH